MYKIHIYFLRNFLFCNVTLPEPSTRITYWSNCRTSRTVPVLSQYLSRNLLSNCKSRTVHSEDYAALGFKVKISPRTASLPATADTGCQSCLAGVNILHPIGLTEDDLIPVTMKMHAVNNNRITILGATVLRFSGKSETDEIINTRQIVYITDSCSKICLSREACVTLGIISSSFPTIGEATNGIDDNTLCCCPQRGLPPP